MDLKRYFVKYTANIFLNCLFLTFTALLTWLIFTTQDWVLEGGIILMFFVLGVFWWFRKHGKILAVFCFAIVASYYHFSKKSSDAISTYVADISDIVPCNPTPSDFVSIDPNWKIMGSRSLITFKTVTATSHLWFDKGRLIERSLLGGHLLKEIKDCPEEGYSTDIQAR